MNLQVSHPSLKRMLEEIILIVPPSRDFDLQERQDIPDVRWPANAFHLKNLSHAIYGNDQRPRTIRNVPYKGVAVQGPVRQSFRSTCLTVPGYTNKFTWTKRAQSTLHM